MRRGEVNLQSCLSLLGVFIGALLGVAWGSRFGWLGSFLGAALGVVVGFMAGWFFVEWLNHPWGRK